MDVLFAGTLGHALHFRGHFLERFLGDCCRLQCVLSIRRYLGSSFTHEGPVRIFGPNPRGVRLNATRMAFAAASWCLKTAGHRLGIARTVKRIARSSAQPSAGSKGQAATS